MDQNEFKAKVKESEELRERAMKMAEESNELVDTDLKKATWILIESMSLWQKGCAIWNEVSSQVNKEAGEDKERGQAHTLAKGINNEKVNDYMVIDYLAKDQLRKLGIEDNEEHGRVFLGDVEEYNGATFRNFPTITTNSTDFKNCTFEDTQAIEFSWGDIQNCTFRNVSEISGHYTDFKNCTFTQCCSQGSFLTVEGGGSVEGCTFDAITALGDSGHIICSIYDSKDEVRLIKNCKLLGCKPESADGLFTYCSYYKRCLTYKTKEIENIDEKSCDFGGEFRF